MSYIAADRNADEGLRALTTETTQNYSLAKSVYGRIVNERVQEIIKWVAR